MSMTETAEMYPLVDYPKYRTSYDDFATLREAAEGLIEGFNFPLSWLFLDEQDEDWEDGDERAFYITWVMPRRTEFTTWTTNKFDRSEVEEWLNGYIRERVDRWYGWFE